MKRHRRSIQNAQHSPHEVSQKGKGWYKEENVRRKFMSVEESHQS